MKSWWRGLAGVAAVLALAQWLGVSERADRTITDAHNRWRAQTSGPFPADILVVGIDDRTVNEFGRLRYWSRSRYADLLDRLREARAVGIDVLVTEPDRQDPRGDAAFARAVRRHGRVVLPLYTWREARPSANVRREADLLIERLPRIAPGAGMDLSPAQAHSLQAPLPALRDAAAGLGYADTNADPDGVYRRPVLVIATDAGKLLPHFTLALASVAKGAPLGGGKDVDPGNVALGDRIVRPLADGTLPLQPLARRGGGFRAGVGQPVPTVSFAEALKLPPDRFRNKIVLVGETAAGTTDIRPNPLDPGLRGVELNAEILANLLYLRPPTPMPGGLHLLLVVAAVGVPAALYRTWAPRRAAWAAAATLVALVGLMEAAFWGMHWLPSWAPVLLGLFSATTIFGLERLGKEEAQKRYLRESFSIYVPPELVERIVENPAIAQEEGVRQHVAALFADVRGFTSYAEANSPELVVQQMQEYLSEMTEAVHVPLGTLDKFIGDEVMALFSPLDEAPGNVSAKAVACAVDMLERLARLNARWEREGMATFRIGIGIHAGDAIVGNFGSPQRRQYTAIGDTVNLASRLQSATKELNGTILVSEAVKQEAESSLTSRVTFIDRGPLAIRGKTQEVRVYEVRYVSEREEERTYEDSSAAVVG